METSIRVESDTLLIENILAHSEDGRQRVEQEIDTVHGMSWVIEALNSRDLWSYQTSNIERKERLTQRDRFILCYSFGLNPKEILKQSTLEKYKKLETRSHSNAEIARAIGISGQRVGEVVREFILFFRGRAFKENREYRCKFLSKYDSTLYELINEQPEDHKRRIPRTCY